MPSRSRQRSTRSDSPKRARKLKPNADASAARLIESLVIALGGQSGKKPSRSVGPKNENPIVIIQPSKEGVVVYCPNKEAACDNLRRLSNHPPQQIEICEQMHSRISQAILEGSRDNLPALKQFKRGLKPMIRNLLKDEPEKSYRKKVRNGREYWYEVWWDPVKQKKRDKYIPLKDVPLHLLAENNTGTS
jgi:hypothetical protein